jgi:fumarate reductase subunit D
LESEFRHIAGTHTVALAMVDPVLFGIMVVVIGSMMVDGDEASVDGGINTTCITKTVIVLIIVFDVIFLW